MNVYEMITTKILAEMEQGTVPWHKSWIGVDAPIRWKDKKVYRGVNTLLLNKPGEHFFGGVKLFVFSVEFLCIL